MTSVLKAHTSTLALVPPAAVWKQIQLARCRHDKSFVRWPPHVNLMYPFAPAGSPALDQACQVAEQALAGIQPFTVTLSRLGSFQHSARSFTLWLDPCSPELVNLQATLYNVLPQYNDLNDDPSRGITQFTPHLSLGQFKNARDLATVQQDLETSWQPISFLVEEVVVMTRKGYLDPFCIERVIPLGGSSSSNSASVSASSSSTSPRVSQRTLWVRVPYVATAGPATQLPHTLALGPASSCDTAGETGAAAAAAGTALHGAPAPTDRGPLHARFGLGGVAIDAGLQAAAHQPSPSSTPQAVPSSPPACWFFAYGTEMDGARLQALGVLPVSTCPAVLQGVCLEFTHRGGAPNLGANTHLTEAANMGMADAAFGVHGVLMGLDAEGTSRLLLSQHERVPVEVWVTRYSTGNSSYSSNDSSNSGGAGSTDAEGSSGRGCWALTLLSPHDRRIGHLPPLDTSVSSLLSAATAAGLDPGYLAHLASLATFNTQASAAATHLTPVAAGAEASTHDRTLAATSLPHAYYTNVFDGRVMREWQNMRTGAQEVGGSTQQLGRGRKAGQGRGRGRVGGGP